MRRFAGVDLGRAAAPDESTILRFRHLLEEHALCGQILDTVNRVWCADFKGWFRSGDGTRIDSLTITDACSRQPLPAALAGCGEDRHRAGTGDLRAAFREYGLPEAIRTDNGAPFASSAVGGLSRLAVWWIKLGIRSRTAVTSACIAP